MILLDVLPLALLGAILGLDVVSFPQAMISRPIVAATAAGALLGAPLSGLLVGATLELFALETLPFGASRYPEWGSAAVVGGALAATHAVERPGVLATAVLVALITAWIGGLSMVGLRRLNARWARTRHEAVARGSRRVVTGLQLYGLTADFARAGLLTGLAYLAARPAQALLLQHWSADARISRAFVVGIAAAVAASAVWKIFHATPGVRWLFLSGIAIGLLLLVLA